MVERSRSKYYEMDKKANEIARLYNLYKIKVCFDIKTTNAIDTVEKFEEGSLDYLPTIENKDKYIRFIYAVESAMKKLKDFHQQILRLEYFNKDYGYWWSSYYSRSSFYRIKRLALEKFLSFFK